MKKPVIVTDKSQLPKILIALFGLITLIVILETISDQLDIIINLLQDV